MTKPEEVEEIVALVRGRIHAEYDGECHLDDDEAYRICSLISRLYEEREEARRYADLGRACEGNGLGWYAEDGTMLFQPPADVIAEQAVEGLAGERAALVSRVTQLTNSVEHHQTLRKRAEAENARLSSLVGEAREEITSIWEVSGGRAASGFNETGRLLRINEIAASLLERLGDGTTSRAEIAARGTESLPPINDGVKLDGGER